ncbi:transglutaminase-like domain-containing protein [Paenibacillus guangzhouensis]|uniref:transglutaminase-like domain-containing protein n=1 Tax=Paenibacillus guangzhouensis TaxID=1473112 RepID=UPI0012674F72|nr:transglutaminase-like domain-containing protein [Paenibacillus guangzhouensis]
MSAHKTSHTVRSAIISILLFGLFAEWLIPLYHLQDNIDFYRISPLFIALACFLIIGCLSLRTAIRMSLFLLVCIGTWISIYASTGTSSMDALRNLVSSVTTNFGLLMQMNGGGGFVNSGELRTGLLLIGWAMLVTSVQSLAIHRQSSILFIGITIIYQLILLWGFGMDTTMGMIRTVTEALLLIALLRIVTLEQVKRSVDGWSRNQAMLLGWPRRWMGGTLIAVMLCFIGGYFLAQRTEQTDVKPIAWDQEFAGLEQWASDTFGTNLVNWLDGAAKTQTASASLTKTATGETGYSENDESLGGALESDPSIVFEATTPVRSYWRGETRRIYDGRGWLASTEAWEPLQQWATIDTLAAEQEDASKSTIEQSIRFTSSNLISTQKWPLFAGGVIIGLNQLHVKGSGEDSTSAVRPANTSEASIQYHPEDGALRIASIGAGKLVTGYMLDVRIPDVVPDQLRQIKESDPASITQDYLQLPDKLPERVSALSKQIITGQMNRYDQVKAIEQYLRTYYTYTLTNTAVPPKGADFVDDFLFKQLKGYCNHFSTAMVVMLRTQGIPARWVKGFAPGEPSEDTANTYTVRMSDAHAWVEVYFPGAGWVPFEPTPGFQPGDEEKGIGSEQLAAHPTPPILGNAASSETGSGSTAADAAATPNAESQVSDWFIRALRGGETILSDLYNVARNGDISWLWKGAWTIGLIALVVWLWLRYQWYIRLHVAILRFRTSHEDPKRIERVARLLWQLWIHQYGAKSQDLTMREYIARLDGKADNKKGSLMQAVFAMEAITFHPKQYDRLMRNRLIQFCKGKNRG